MLASKLRISNRNIRTQESLQRQKEESKKRKVKDHDASDAAEKDRKRVKYEPTYQMPGTLPEDDSTPAKTLPPTASQFADTPPAPVKTQEVHPDEGIL